MFWLANHQDVQMPRHEVHAMIAGRPAELVRTLYDELEPGYHYKRGYKAPRDITNANALTAFATYFPTTRLIIGVRHPVLWFQSFYNYRVRGGTVMPPAETLMVRVCPRMCRERFVFRRLTDIIVFLSSFAFRESSNHNGMEFPPTNPCFMCTSIISARPPEPRPKNWRSWAATTGVTTDYRGRTIGSFCTSPVSSTTPTRRVPINTYSTCNTFSDCRIHCRPLAPRG
jgi:hypothetical protein